MIEHTEFSSKFVISALNFDGETDGMFDIHHFAFILNLAFEQNFQVSKSPDIIIMSGDLLTSKFCSKARFKMNEIFNVSTKSRDT